MATAVYDFVKPRHNPAEIRYLGNDYVLGEDDLYYRTMIVHKIPLQVPMHVKRIKSRGSGWLITIVRKNEGYFSAYFADSAYEAAITPSASRTIKQQAAEQALEAAIKTLRIAMKRFKGHAFAKRSAALGKAKQRRRRDDLTLRPGVIVTIRRAHASSGSRTPAVVVGCKLGGQGRGRSMRGPRLSRAIYSITEPLFEQMLRKVTLYRIYLEHQFAAGKPASQKHFDYLSSEALAQLKAQVDERELISFNDLLLLIEQQLGPPPTTTPKNVTIKTMLHDDQPVIEVQRTDLANENGYRKLFRLRDYPDADAACHMAYWYGAHITQFCEQDKRGNKEATRPTRSRINPRTGEFGVGYRADEISGKVDWIGSDYRVKPARKRSFAACRYGFEAGFIKAIAFAREAAGKIELPEHIILSRLQAMAPLLLKGLPQAAIDRYKLGDFLARRGSPASR